MIFINSGLCIPQIEINIFTLEINIFTLFGYNIMRGNPHFPSKEEYVYHFYKGVI